MEACAVEATIEIKIMAGDELLCRIPKLTELETASAWITCDTVTLISILREARVT